MHNRQPVNTEPMNTGPIPYEILSEVGLINFGGFDLTECDQLYIKAYDYDNLGRVNIETVPYPYFDGSLILSVFTTEKELNFKMLINAQDETEFNNIVDNIKRRLYGTKPLDVVVNGKRRRTMATLADLKINRNLDVGRIQTDIDIRFVSHSPHFRLKDPVSYSTGLQNGSSVFLDFTNNGSAISNYIVIVVFGAGNTGITQATLGQGGFPIVVNENINDGDVLVFSGEEMDCFLNGVRVRYTGQFQTLELGANPMTLSFNGSSREYSVTAKFKEQYR